MKREARQHGVVRSYPILPPDPLSPHDQQSRRHVKTIDSALVKGVFTKVSRKPTNQSKFTGKCGKAQCLGCHIHPATKSKDKTKGTMKMRSIGSDHGRVGYPVGTSATGVLSHLAGGIDHYIDDYIDDYNEDYVNDHYYSDHKADMYAFASVIASEEEEEEDEYCDVGLCWGADLYDVAAANDDGWYLVWHSH